MNQDFSPSPDLPVIVIGGAGVDMIGRLDGDLVAGTKNPAKIRTSFGGVARNVAENLSRLGHRTVLLTAVGEDHAGKQLLAQAVQAGVDISHVLTTPDHATGTYLGILDSNGTLKFGLDDINATQALTPDYIKSHAALFKQASLVFIDTNLPKPALRTIFTLARRARIPVCADPTAAGLAVRLSPFLERLSLITPNGEEAGVLCDRSIENAQPQEALEAAKCLVAKGVGIVLVSLAEYGVVYATSETSGIIPAIRTTIVDPTGAGDALNATVIYALLNQIPLDDAVRLGVTAASLTLRHRGTVVDGLSLEMLYDQLVI